MHRCVRWGTSGAALGLAMVAWADPSVGGDAGFMVDLLKVGGLPAILTAVLWQLAKWQPKIVVEHRMTDGVRAAILSELDRQRLTDALLVAERHLAAMHARRIADGEEPWDTRQAAAAVLAARTRLEALDRERRGE